MALYEDKTFPVPETFYDDYKGRRVAAVQEMNIAKDDMDMIYDLKMLAPGKDSYRKVHYERFLSRMDSAQRAAWDAFYDPIIKDFLSRT